LSEINRKGKTWTALEVLSKTDSAIGAEGFSTKFKTRILVAAAFAVGVVFASPSQAHAPTDFIELLAPKQYAAIQVKAIWGDPKHYRCLAALWGKESAWNPKAQNPIKVNGKRAGGIPQILGLSPKLPAHVQVDRGLKYIKHRYNTPCAAWKFWQKGKWY
jgi:hypothetical protein